MEIMTLRVAWSYASTKLGEPSATVSGLNLRVMLCAVSLAFSPSTPLHYMTLPLVREWAPYGSISCSVSDKKRDSWTVSTMASAPWTFALVTTMMLALDV